MRALRLARLSRASGLRSDSCNLILGSRQLFSDAACGSDAPFPPPPPPQPPSFTFSLFGTTTKELRGAPKYCSPRLLHMCTPPDIPQMTEQSTEGRVQRVRNSEYLTAPDGTQSKRKVNPDGTRTPWVPASLSPPPAEETPPLVLLLVLEKQAEGEPKHWYLFVAPEAGSGSAYQVTGDATFMRYESWQDASPLSSESYHTSYVLARLTEGQGEVVRLCTEAEAPPRAVDRASVRENCQGWAIRVLRRLREAGVVGEEWVRFAEGIEEPV